MIDVFKFIESGILEMYVLDLASDAERRRVEQMADQYPVVRQEIKAIELSLEQLASQNARTPSPTIKPFLMATIDYTERLKNGETPSFPPELTEQAHISDYKDWLERADMTLPADFEEFHARIIGYTPEMITAIAWIKTMAPDETHDDEFEKFLILEGSCDIIIGDKTHSLVAGDYLSIPLHTEHRVVITSSIPCKVILQRVAA
ncbi:MAG: cupin domain-containing protein [Bacteroidetes bacterium]|nr:cupin domain-containing protein [Bacteroidota bacterium]